MHLSRLGILTAITLLSGALSVEAQKDKKNLDAQGMPHGLKAGESARYGIWHDQHGWHIRTTTANKKHTFKGRIEVQGGSIEDIRSYHLEKNAKVGDHWKVDTKKNGLQFDFGTDGGMDGINFDVSKGAKSIKFQLTIDGKEKPELIFIGHDGHHPKDIPFTLPAHPAKKK